MSSSFFSEPSRSRLAKQSSIRYLRIEMNPRILCRGKGKRGGLRVIYYWWDAGSQFWLFTVFDKNEMSDLSANERKALKEMIKQELEARRKR